MKHSPLLKAIPVEIQNTVERMRQEAKAALREADRLMLEGRFIEAQWRINWARNWYLWGDRIIAQVILPAREIGKGAGR